MENLFNSFIDLASSYSKVRSLAAIWFDRPVQTATEKTVRLTKGHLLRIEKLEVKNVTEDCPATHRIIDCKGNISNSILLLELENLKNGDTLTLNVK